jgi:hypothetical protein
MTLLLDAPATDEEYAHLFTVATRMREAGAATAGPPGDYEGWLQFFFPAAITAAFAERHHRFWRWVWAIEPGVRPPVVPVLLWPRGGAKSTSVELGCAAIGARGTRRYVLYVSGKQSQADDHVRNVAALLESETIGRQYPDLGERKVNKFGSSLGWRRNRIRTASGFTMDALGLDVVARGVKLEEQRPDLIVFDDVDDTADSIETVKKKITAITQKILPSEAPEAGAIFVQNLVHYESVAARLAGLASEEADFLADREVSGPYPAVIGLRTERIPGTLKHRIVGGRPTWEGQDLATCEAQIVRWGLKAFLAEAQHARTPPEGQAFPEWDADVHVVRPFAPPASWPRYRSVDYGYAAPMCCLWGAKRPDGTLVIYRELYGTGMTAPMQAKRVAALSGTETYAASLGDPSMWASNREGKKVKSVSQMYRENGVTLLKAANERVAGWSLLHTLLDHDDERPPMLTVTRDCPNLIRTLPIMVKDSNKPEDIDTDLEDHAPDALRYLAMKAAGHLLAAAFDRAAAPEAPPTPEQRARRAAINGPEYREERPASRERLAAGWR